MLVLKFDYSKKSWFMDGSIKKYFKDINSVDEIINRRKTGHKEKKDDLWTKSNKPSTLIDHLIELRSRLLNSFIFS